MFVSILNESGKVPFGYLIGFSVFLQLVKQTEIRVSVIC